MVSSHLIGFFAKHENLITWPSQYLLVDWLFCETRISNHMARPIFTYCKSTIETPEQCEKSVQNYARETPEKCP